VFDIIDEVYTQSAEHQWILYKIIQTSMSVILIVETKFTLAASPLVSHREYADRTYRRTDRRRDAKPLGLYCTFRSILSLVYCLQTTKVPLPRFKNRTLTSMVSKTPQ